MEFKVLNKDTSDHLVKSLGKLYKIMVPGINKSASSIGNGIKNEVVSNNENLEKIDIKYILPPYYLAVDEGEVIGYGMIQYKLLQDNTIQNSCYAHIFVHPDRRREGIGSKIIEEMLANLKRNHSNPVSTRIKSIFFFAEDEAAKQFLLAHDGKLTEDSLNYELELTSNYKKISLEQINKYTTEIVINPEANELIEFMKVYHITKLDEPRGNDERYDPLSVEDFIDTIQKYTDFHLVGMLKYNDQIIGVTDLMQPSVDGRLNQRFTGIHPDFRGRGLAKLLKFNVLRWITENRSDLLPLTIETSTLVENIPMQKTNEALGFSKTGHEMTIEFS